MTNDRSRLKTWLHFIGPQVFYCLLGGIFLGVALSGAELALAYGLQAFLLNLGLVGSTQVSLPRWIPSNELSSVILFVFAIGVTRALLQWASIYFQGVTLESFVYLQRSRLLRWAFYSKSVKSDEVVTLFGQKASNAANSLMTLQASIVQGTTVLLLGFTIFKMAPAPTLASIVLLAVFFLPLKKVDHKLKIAGLGIASEWDNTHRRLLMSIKNLLLLQIYGTQHKEETHTQTSLSAYRKHLLANYQISGMSFALPQIFSVIIICGLGISTRFPEGLSGSIFVSYVYLFVRFAQNLSELSRSRATLLFNLPQVEQLFEWWTRHSANEDSVGHSLGSKTQLPANGPIGWKLNQIGFTFPGSNDAIFENLSLEIQPGRTWVVIGPSGVGKSTFLGLLLGGLTPTRGQIYVQAERGWTQPLSECLQSVLEHIGYVGPESFLIEGSVKDNLHYGLHREPSPSELSQAIEWAQCHFINELPGGLNHRLTEQGQGLSAGQKQRLSLARALLRNPKALILDEATSNLDSETENKLIETFRQLKSKMTLVIVTHRQALLQIADEKLELGDIFIKAGRTLKLTPGETVSHKQI